MTAALADHVAAHNARLLFAVRVGEAVEGTVAAPSRPAPAGVRFLYAHPADWYVTLAEGPDTLTGPDAETWGWDLRKALRLLLRSNPLLWSWLASPDVLHDPVDLGETLRRLAHAGYSRRALGHALWDEARKALTAYLERGQAVTATKSLKAARALLALRWLEAGPTLPPLAVQALLEAGFAPADVRAEIAALRSAPQDKHAALYRWINAELDTAAARCAALPDGTPDPAAADALYRAHVIGNNAVRPAGAGPDRPGAIPEPVSGGVTFP